MSCFKWKQPISRGGTSVLLKTKPGYKIRSFNSPNACCYWLPQLRYKRKLIGLFAPDHFGWSCFLSNLKNYWFLSPYCAEVQIRAKNCSGIGTGKRKQLKESIIFEKRWQYLLLASFVCICYFPIQKVPHPLLAILSAFLGANDATKIGRYRRGKANTVINAITFILVSLTSYHPW